MQYFNEKIIEMSKLRMLVFFSRYLSLLNSHSPCLSLSLSRIEPFAVEFCVFLCDIFVIRTLIWMRVKEKVVLSTFLFQFGIEREIRLFFLLGLCLLWLLDHKNRNERKEREREKEKIITKSRMYILIESEKKIVQIFCFIRLAEHLILRTVIFVNNNGV